MVIDRKTHKLNHKHFYDIVEYLKLGDLLVWNNSKVFKARLRGRILLDELTDGLKKTTGKSGSPFSDVILNIPQVEIFLVRPMENPGVWKVLARPGKKLRLGMQVVFAEDFVAEIICKEKDGTILVQFNEDDFSVRSKANKYGEVPLPPYVGNEQGTMNKEQVFGRYQTVYAKEEGSVAAPTAGFHFTPELIEKLKAKGVQFAEVTLHVGLGTFLPVKTDSIEEHQMHSEWVEITSKNADLINAAKAEGGRVVAVGTTTVRTLEGVYRICGQLKAFCGDINIFISPGFQFKVVDALITNFHLPKSTLLMLVSAFTEDRLAGRSLGEGREFVLECYKKAVEAKYRFYSFGDAMFLT